MTLRIVLGVTVLALTIAAGLAFDIWRHAHDNASGPADAALVLGAAVDGATPSPVLVERLRHAATLLAQGRAGRILVTGGRSPEDRLSEAEASRDWLIGTGVRSQAILIEDRSRTTIENLAFSAPILAGNGLHSVLIVSDPLHLRRALLIARRLGLAAAPSPTPSSRYRSWRTQLQFLARETWFLAQCLATGL